MQHVDQKIRELFAVYDGLHPKSDVNRFYIPRKEEEIFDMSLARRIELTESLILLFLETVRLRIWRRI